MKYPPDLVPAQIYSLLWAGIVLFYCWETRSTTPILKCEQLAHIHASAANNGIVSVWQHALTLAFIKRWPPCQICYACCCAKAWKRLLLIYIISFPNRTDLNYLDKKQHYFKNIPLFSITNAQKTGFYSMIDYNHNQYRLLCGAMLVSFVSMLVSASGRYRAFRNAALSCLFAALLFLCISYVLPLLVRISYVQMEELLHTALQQLRVLAVWYLGAFASLALLSFIMKKSMRSWFYSYAMVSKFKTGGFNPIVFINRVAFSLLQTPWSKNPDTPQAFLYTAFQNSQQNNHPRSCISCIFMNKISYAAFSCDLRYSDKQQRA